MTVLTPKRPLSLVEAVALAPTLVLDTEDAPLKVAKLPVLLPLEVLLELDADSVVLAEANLSSPAVTVTGKNCTSDPSSPKVLTPGSFAADPPILCVHIALVPAPAVVRRVHCALIVKSSVVILAPQTEPEL